MITWERLLVALEKLSQSMKKIQGICIRDVPLVDNNDNTNNNVFTVHPQIQALEWHRILEKGVWLLLKGLVMVNFFLINKPIYQYLSIVIE